MGKSIHAVPHKNGWACKKEGSNNYIEFFDTKIPCVDYARDLAQKEKSELFIHGKDGKIQSRDSYGNDPFPPKG